MKEYFGWAICIGLLSALTVPVNAFASTQQAEMSLVVTGSLDIEEDGSVADYKIDNQELASDGVMRVIRETVGRWKFDPVIEDGRPVKVRVDAAFRVVARFADGGYQTHVANVSFASDPEEWVTGRSLRVPDYPGDAHWRGIKGTVYVVARIGRDGKPNAILAEQVNLVTIDHDANAKMWRNQLARAAVRGARQWRFNPPSAGPHANADQWNVRIPVDFGGELSGSDGTWHVYLPGPRQKIPWLPDEQGPASDAYVAGMIYPVGVSPRLAFKDG